MKTAFFGLAGAFALSAAGAANAATIVFNTTSPTNSVLLSQAVTSGGVTATFTGGTYTGSVQAMNAGQGNAALTARNVRRTTTGLGVAGDSETDQVDSNGLNELLQVVFSTPSRYRIVSATIGKVDNTDTFALFGGNGGTYTRLGFTGPVWGGITGGIPVTTTRIGTGAGSERIYQLDFNYGGGFDSFRFGTNDEEADGFSLRSLSVAVVPEPSTWALLILGFGLTGAALRRKTREGARGKASLSFA